jgi:hypothetical protein
VSVLGRNTGKLAMSRRDTAKFALRREIFRRTEKCTTRFRPYLMS